MGLKYGSTEHSNVGWQDILTHIKHTSKQISNAVTGEGLEQDSKAVASVLEICSKSKHKWYPATRCTKSSLIHRIHKILTWWFLHTGHMVSDSVLGSFTLEIFSGGASVVTISSYTWCWRKKKKHLWKSMYPTGSPHALTLNANSKLETCSRPAYNCSFKSSDRQAAPSVLNVRLLMHTKYNRKLRDSKKVTDTKPTERIRN